jgi:hypothetical protein
MAVLKLAGSRKRRRGRNLTASKWQCKTAQPGISPGWMRRLSAVGTMSLAFVGDGRTASFIGMMSVSW